MKKGAKPPSTKSAAISASERSVRINRNADSSCSQENFNASSRVFNRKTKSSQDLAFSKSIKSSTVNSDSARSCLQEFLPKCKVDEMSPEQMHESLIRVKNCPVQPFSFLSKVLDERSLDDQVSIGRTKPTEIDMKLAALTRRVNLNKSLLERTNERVKEINFLVERNAMMASRELNYDNDALERTKGSGDGAVDIESNLNTACPGIMELQRTINQTNDMLGYVKKICSDEMQISDLPGELATFAAANQKK